MASEFVRKVKGIRNIDILSPNITTENDLISTIDGEVYVATNKGYRKITGVETKEIKQLKTDVSNVKIQSDTNTLSISDNTDDIETNTSEIEALKTSTDNNTSEIETLKTSTENNTSEIGTLQTSTDNNTSEIGTLQSDVNTNTSDIGTLKTDTSSNETTINELLNEINTLKSNMLQHQVIYTGSANGTGTVMTLDNDIYDYKFIIISGTYPGGTFNETVLISTLTGNINFQKDNLRDRNGTFLGIYEIKITANTGTEMEITNDISWDEQGNTGTGQDRNAFTITNIEGVK